MGAVVFAARARARARAPAAAVSADPASLHPLVARVRDVVVLSTLPASPPRAAGAAEAPCALAPADPSRPRAAFHRLFATLSWFFRTGAAERTRAVRCEAASCQPPPPCTFPVAHGAPVPAPERTPPTAAGAERQRGGRCFFAAATSRAGAAALRYAALCDAHTRPVHAHRRRCYAADEASALLYVRPGQGSHCSCLRCSRVRAPGVRQAQRLPLRASKHEPVRARPATNVN